MDWRSYDLNWQDRICATDGAWDSFAVAIGGRGAMTARIMGGSVWNSIAGLETRSFLNALFFAVRRSGKPIALPCRCDSALIPRLYTMTISPLPDEGLRIRHVEIPLRHLPVAGPAVVRPMRHVQRKCSVCCAYQLGDHWIDPFRHPLQTEFPVDSGLCPDCKHNAMRLVSQMNGPASWVMGKTG